MQLTEAKSRIDSRFHSAIADTPGFHSGVCLVHSGPREVHWSFAAGRTEEGPVEPDQPVYAASIGKAFTATVVATLVERDVLSFEDPIASHLPAAVLDGLHVYRGTDYTDDIQVGHLLNHTSGLPHLLSDEFGLFSRRTETSPEGQTFFDVVVEDPDRFWEPQETIEWAKANLHPHFPPGEGIYYSQVGYNLLGLLVEHVTDRPFHSSGPASPSGSITDTDCCDSGHSRGSLDTTAGVVSVRRTPSCCTTPATMSTSSGPSTRRYPVARRFDSSSRRYVRSLTSIGPASRRGPGTSLPAAMADERVRGWPTLGGREICEGFSSWGDLTRFSVEAV